MRSFMCRTVLCALLVALTLATASQAQEHVFPGCSWFVCYPTVNPTPSVLFYAPADSIINTATVSYQAATSHCTSVWAEIWIDDHYVGDTGWVPPGGQSAVFDVTVFTQGADSITVSLINPICNGGEGCCPADSVISYGWAGNICLVGTLDEPTGVAADPAARINNSFRIFSYPNPCNADATLLWEASRPSSCVLQLFDVTGRLVKTFGSQREAAPTSGSVTWDCRDEAGVPVASGIYFAVLSSASGRATHRLVLVR